MAVPTELEPLDARKEVRTASPRDCALPIVIVLGRVTHPFPWRFGSGPPPPRAMPAHGCDDDEPSRRERECEKRVIRIERDDARRCGRQYRRLSRLEKPEGTAMRKGLESQPF